MNENSDGWREHQIFVLSELQRLSDGQIRTEEKIDQGFREMGDKVDALISNVNVNQRVLGERVKECEVHVKWTSGIYSAFGIVLAAIASFFIKGAK